MGNRIRVSSNVKFLVDLARERTVFHWVLSPGCTYLPILRSQNRRWLFPWMNRSKHGEASSERSRWPIADTLTECVRCCLHSSATTEHRVVQQRGKPFAKTSAILSFYHFLCWKRKSNKKRKERNTLVKRLENSRAKSNVGFEFNLRSVWSTFLHCV